MRVRRSEALRTRMETRRQNTLLATAFSNVLNNTNSSLYADLDTLIDAEYEAKKQRDQDALLTENEEAVLTALRAALESGNTSGTPGYDAISNHNSVALRMEDPGIGVVAVSPNSFVKKSAHVLSNASDAELNRILRVILRGDNSEAVFHYTGDDIKRLLICYLESVRRS